MNYDINLILKTDYSKLYFLYNSDLRISSAVKYLGINIIKHCEALKMTISSLLLISNSFTAMIRALLFLRPALRLHFPYPG